MEKHFFLLSERIHLTAVAANKDKLKPKFLAADYAKSRKETQSTFNLSVECPLQIKSLEIRIFFACYFFIRKL